jgi:hypothetical protein
VSSNLIPKGEQYFDNEMNVLLIGLHGVGKTEGIVSMCRERGITLKYYSCSTLDPFTDLVGVPTPRMFCRVDRVFLRTGETTCPVCGSGLDSEDSEVVEALKMVRPHEIDDAELLFFDEFNRADEKTQNAVFEIIQFRSINGERLPNVKACWAAMNPPDTGDGKATNYKVSDLDPALVDRFDVFIQIDPKPSVTYMAQTLPKPIAQALYSWWGEHNQQRRGIDHFISPRRLSKIGQVYQATGDFRPAIPRWIDCDKQKLANLLERAENDLRKQANKPGGKLGDGPNPNFTYEEGWIQENRMTVMKYLADNQEDMDTHRAVLKVIEGKQGRTLVREFGEVLNALKPALLEGFIGQMAPGKYQSFKEGITKLPAHRYQLVPNLRQQVGLS